MALSHCGILEVLGKRGDQTPLSVIEGGESYVGTATAIKGRAAPYRASNSNIGRAPRSWNVDKQPFQPNTFNVSIISHW